MLRPATARDFDRLVGRLTPFGRLSSEQRGAFLSHAVVRDAPAGTRIVEHGAPASSAYFILDGSPRPVPSRAATGPVDDGRGGLLR